MTGITFSKPPQQVQPDAPLFITRVNGGSVLETRGPFTTIEAVNGEAKKIKKEFPSSQVYILTAIAEVKPVEDPYEIREL